jgi:hypothetical protein
VAEILETPACRAGPERSELMGLQGEQTRDWFSRARSTLVNGVSSQFRYWGDDDTIVTERGEAGHLFDDDVAITLQVFEESLDQALL